MAIETDQLNIQQTLILTALSSPPSNPVEGTMYVNNVSGNHLYIYLNSDWVLIV